jgi:hypothetical protein
MDEGLASRLPSISRLALLPLDNIRARALGTAGAAAHQVYPRTRALHGTPSCFASHGYRRFHFSSSALLASTF